MKKPMAILAGLFKGNMPVAAFAKEVAELKASCPDETKGNVTSFKDFVELCGKQQGETVDWSTGTPA